MIKKNIRKYKIIEKHIEFTRDGKPATSAAKGFH